MDKIDIINNMTILLNSRVTVIEGQVSALLNEDWATQGELNALQNQINLLNAETASLRSQINNLNYQGHRHYFSLIDGDRYTVVQSVDSSRNRYTDWTGEHSHYMPGHRTTVYVFHDHYDYGRDTSSAGTHIHYYYDRDTSVYTNTYYRYITAFTYPN